MVLDPTSTGQGFATGLLEGAVYEVGKTYTLTAVPTDADSAFDRWTGTGLSAAATELPKLTFVFSSALAAEATPTIKVKFVSNPFRGSTTGSFNGLIAADGGTPATNSTNGFINVNITAISGAFTGKVLIDGGSAAISGVFNNAGVARFGVTRSLSTSVPRIGKAPLVLSMVLNVAAKQINGTLKDVSRSNVTPQSTFTADRAHYSSMFPLSGTPSLLNQLTKGYYTVAFPARTAATASLAGAALTNADFPQGDGVGSMTLTKTGLVTFTGTLADGTPFTSSGVLDQSHRTIIFASLYTKKGAIGGKVKFDLTQADSDVAGTDFFWFRPYQPTQHYPWGWPEGLLSDLVGTKYAAPVGASAVPLLPAATLGGNATLTFSDGLLNGGSLLKSVNISTANVVTNAPLTDKSFTLKVTPATGAISGTFTHTDGTKPTFDGRILQKGANRAAFGYFLTTKPKVVTGTGESGGVTLMHK